MIKIHEYRSGKCKVQIDVGKYAEKRAETGEGYDTNFNPPMIYRILPLNSRYAVAGIGSGELLGIDMASGQIVTSVQAHGAFVSDWYLFPQVGEVISTNDIIIV